MWTIIRFKTKQLNILKEEFYKKLGKDLIFYNPKILIQSLKKKKFSNIKVNLLGDYIFCYHKSFKSISTLNNLRFSKGLKYFLEVSSKSQNEIESFILKLKKLEDTDGLIKKNIHELIEDKNYKFISGPFTNQIFSIIRLQRRNMEVLIGNLKTKIKKNKFLFNPI